MQNFSENFNRFSHNLVVIKQIEMFHRTTGPRLTRGYSAIVITENGFVKAHGKKKKSFPYRQ
jgi:hypothetical protein